MSEGNPTERRESGSSPIESARDWLRNHKQAVILSAGLMMASAGAGAAYERQTLTSNDATVKELVENSPELSGVEFFDESYRENGGSVLIQAGVEVAGKKLHVTAVFTDGGARALHIEEDVFGGAEDHITKSGDSETAEVQKDDKSGHFSVGPVSSSGPSGLN